MPYLHARSEALVRGTHATTLVACGTTVVVTKGRNTRGRYTAPGKAAPRQQLAQSAVKAAPHQQPVQAQEPRELAPPATRDTSPVVERNVEYIYRRRGEALKTLGKMRQNREAVEAGVMRWVGKSRLAGATWAEIGSALGVSQQAASKRYRRG